MIAISSEYGSVSENTDGFPYYYAASKAALDMLMRSLAAEARRRGIVAAILDPGWVRTDMGGPQAPLTPARSVAGMMAVIDGLTARDGGRFYTWEGAAAPWQLQASGALGLALEVLGDRLEEQPEGLLLGPAGDADVGVGHRGGPEEPTLLLDDLYFEPHGPFTAAGGRARR